MFAAKQAFVRMMNRFINAKTKFNLHPLKWITKSDNEDFIAQLSLVPSDAQLQICWV